MSCEGRKIWKKEIKDVDNILISRGNNCIHWWDSNIKDLSSHLWLPHNCQNIEIDYPSLINTSFTCKKSVCDKELKYNKNNLYLTEENNKNISTNIKVRRLRIYPTENEKEELNKILAAFRWSYNAVVDITEKNKETEEYKELIKNNVISYSKLREYINTFSYVETETEKTFEKNNNSSSFPLPPFLIEQKIHNRIPRGAIKSFTGNLNSALANGGKFQMKFKKSKTQTEECLFEDKSYPVFIKKIKGCFRKGRKITEKWSEIQKTHSKGLIIIKDKLKNKWYLLLPIEVEENISVPNKDIEKQDIISLDTGVRTFQTGYSPQGEIVEIGKDDSKYIFSLLQQTDKLAKQYKHRKDIKNEKFKKKQLFLYLKIKNLINELHWKTIKFLTESYKMILIPDFRISGMVKSSKLSKSTKRLLYIFSYFKFKTRLLWKAKIAGVKVFVVDESFTSKTCGRCGWQNESLGGNKIFCCQQCSLKIDRDYNGARNILLKHLA